MRRWSFLVNHDGQRFALGDSDAAGAFGGGVGLADQVALDEKLAIDVRSVVEVNVEKARRKIGAQDRVADLVLQRLALRTRAAREERKAGHVPRQADAR